MYLWIRPAMTRSTSAFCETSLSFSRSGEPCSTVAIRPQAPSVSAGYDGSAGGGGGAGGGGVTATAGAGSSANAVPVRPAHRAQAMLAAMSVRRVRVFVLDIIEWLR